MSRLPSVAIKRSEGFLYERYFTLKDLISIETLDTVSKHVGHVNGEVGVGEGHVAVEEVARQLR